MAHSNDLLRHQSRLLGWLHQSGAWSDAQISDDLGLDRTTTGRWRNGSREAPLGLLGHLLARLPVLDVFQLLSHLAARYGARDGFRVVVTLEEESSGNDDPDGMREATDELVVQTGNVVAIARKGPPGAIAQAASQAGRAAARVAAHAQQIPLFRKLG